MVVTWSLLAALGVVGLLGLRNLIRHTRQQRRQVDLLRLHLELLDIIREAQLVLSGVRRSDFRSPVRLSAISERLKYLVSQLDELETNVLRKYEEHQLSPSQTLEKYLPAVRGSLDQACSKLDQVVERLEADSHDESH